MVAGLGGAFGLAGVSVRLAGRTVLADVTLPVPAGQVTAVVGGDGAGKTTLMRALVGRVPCSGTVQAPEARRLGYLPASTGSWRSMSVQENIDFVGGSYGLSGAELAGRSAELLAAAGLEQFRERLSGQLSGGMRRKLGICLAMLHRPDLLVLDEPSTGVDPVSRVDLWRMTSQAAAAGAAVLMSTSYLDEAERATTLLVLDGGRQLLFGSPAEVLAGLPGIVVAVSEPVRRDWAWRRGRVFHEWWPDGGTPSGSRQIQPDLEDIVIARTLHRSASPAGTR